MLGTFCIFGPFFCFWTHFGLGSRHAKKSREESRLCRLDSLRHVLAVDFDVSGEAGLVQPGVAETADSLLGLLLQVYAPTADSRCHYFQRRWLRLRLLHSRLGRSFSAHFLDTAPRCHCLLAPSFQRGRVAGLAG